MKFYCKFSLDNNLTRTNLIGALICSRYWLHMQSFARPKVTKTKHLTRETKSRDKFMSLLMTRIDVRVVEAARSVRIIYSTVSNLCPVSASSYASLLMACYRVLWPSYFICITFEKPQGRDHLTRRMRGWEVEIKIGLNRLGRWKWIQVDHNRVRWLVFVNTFVDFLVL